VIRLLGRQSPFRAKGARTLSRASDTACRQPTIENAVIPADKRHSHLDRMRARRIRILIILRMRPYMPVRPCSPAVL